MTKYASFMNPGWVTLHSRYGWPSSHFTLDRHAIPIRTICGESCPPLELADRVTTNIRCETCMTIIENIAIRELGMTWFPELGSQMRGIKTRRAGGQEPDGGDSG